MRTFKFTFYVLVVLSLSGCPNKTEAEREVRQQIITSSMQPIDHDEEVYSAYKKSMQINVSKLWLWRLTKNETSFFVFGTMHQGIGLRDLPQCLKSIVKKSSVFISEINFAAIEEEEQDRLPLAKESGRKMIEVITPELWRTYLKLVEIEEPFIKDIDESLARTLLTKIGASRRSKYIRMDELDYSLAELAADSKVPLEGLETISDRNKIQKKWLSVSTTMQEENTKDINKILGEYELDYFKKSLILLYQVVESYKSGEEVQIQNAFSKFILLSEPYPKEMLVTRNKLWGEVVQARNSMNNAFIAVGLGHLLGPDNFLQILETQGWRSERLTSCD